jgi:hypothetical protein
VCETAGKEDVVGETDRGALLLEDLELFEGVELGGDESQGVGSHVDTGQTHGERSFAVHRI